ncbi:MAG: glycoside hydrolase family 2 sugar binding protein [Gemmatimonadetes bacterium]|nr:glycoside hydrolase family 2 sugar binding protein [Gemmatimonadota bacterium]
MCRNSSAGSRTVVHELLSAASRSALLVFALAMPITAQRATPALAWPALTREAKPWTRWWWLGSAVDSAGITAQLGELAAAGFGGVEVTVIYGAKGADSSYIPYLSRPWVDMIAHTATEAHRRGMGLDLPQGSGWRMGGPSVVPADANTSLSVRVDSVAGGDTWHAQLTGRWLETAFAQSGDEERLAIPFDQGRVSWKAPPGKWIIYVAETRFSGDNVKRPAPGGEGPSIDPFSAKATANYLAMFSDRMSSIPRGAIRSYFHDSFEYTGDASSDLFTEFRKARGYSLGSEVPALAGRGDVDHIARVKSDYRQTLDEMLLKNFVEHLTNWSHARGALMREQAHGSPGNLLDLYAASDIPETEIFGVLRGPDADPLINKFASSAAHVAGHRLASAESFTWLGEHFTATLDQVKQAADRMFLAGINHLIYHGTAYSPPKAAWPGWQFYASTEFNPRNAAWRDLPAFNQYVARVQSFMQAGEPDGDVLLYWPIADNWHDATGRRMDFRVHDPKWFHDKPFGKLARQLHESGYGVDYVSDRQLSNHVTSQGGRLRAHSASYSALVVPSTVHMPPETFARMVELSRQGANVIFLGELPSDVPGLSRLDERRATLAAATRAIAWSATSGGVRIASVGKGRVYAGDDLAALLAASGVRRDPLAEQEELQLIRRKSAVGRDYFVVASRHIDRWVPLAGSPASVALMDPMSGRAGGARMRRVGSHVEARLQLDSGQSMILRTFDKLVRATAWSYADSAGAPVAVRGSWTVSFVDGGPVLPKAFIGDSPVAWTGRGDDDADRFAGTARYTINFDAPDGASRHLLTLGKVAESARVKLNGRELGVLFTSPFTIETGLLRPTGNTLEVEVTNVSANRIRDLDRRGVEWKIFRDINFVGIDYKPFDASQWPVRASGLLGPVTLQPIVDREPPAGARPFP